MSIRLEVQVALAQVHACFDSPQGIVLVLAEIVHQYVPYTPAGTKIILRIYHVTWTVAFGRYSSLYKTNTLITL